MTNVNIDLPPTPSFLERTAQRSFENDAKAVGAHASGVVCLLIIAFSTWLNDGSGWFIWFVPALLQANLALTVHGYNRLVARYDERLRLLAPGEPR